MKVVGTTHMSTVTLDSIAADQGLKPDCLKIDVQGAELDILQGGVNILQSVKVVELEVEFNYQYMNQPLFSDVDVFMRNHGFCLLALRRSYWRRKSDIGHYPTTAGGQIIHGDALYYNDSLLKNAGDTGIANLVKWLMAFSAYRQHDFIVYLLYEYPVAKELSDSDRTELLKRLIPKPKPHWRLLRRFLPLLHRFDHQTLRQWVIALRSAPAEDWHDPEFF